MDNTKNKIRDLNNHLYLELERLNDDDMTLDEMKLESQRAASMAGIAKSIIAIASLQMAATKMLIDIPTIEAQEIKACLPTLFPENQEGKEKK